MFWEFSNHFILGDAMDWVLEPGFCLYEKPQAIIRSNTDSLDPFMPQVLDKSVLHWWINNPLQGHESASLESSLPWTPINGRASFFGWRSRRYRSLSCELRRWGVFGWQKVSQYYDSNILNHRRMIRQSPSTECLSNPLGWSNLC